MAELAEVARQAVQRADAERAERERLIAEKATAERRAAELAEAVRQAAQRAEAEGRERERLAVEKAVVERRLLELAEDARKGEAPAEERNPQIRTLSPIGGIFGAGGRASESPAEPTPKPSSRPAVPGAFFRVAWELNGIAYDSVDEVQEVHQSINLTQLSLEGYPNQYCSAYIIVLQKGGKRRVYVAFRLSASKRALVYVPGNQPCNQGDYVKVMKEAGKFLRVTGIETERVPLGKSPQSRARALSQISVLSALPRSAENF